MISYLATLYPQERIKENTGINNEKQATTMINTVVTVGAYRVLNLDYRHKACY